MVQGTGSHVGKSLLVAALARAFTRRGLAVRPFKPQNMSNNAAVAEGGEIGRAQALQARACGVAPTADMNPVLLKPQSATGAQVVVQGRVEGTATAREYHAWKPRLLPRVLESFDRVGRGADLVLVEGAGSPAEVNLREGDIANMGFALAAGVPVVLVGDVDRGGVIASLIGTFDLLPDEERGLLKGYVINKFRGDPRLFDGAAAVIGARTGLPMLGLVPHAEAARRLPAEDSVALDSHATGFAPGEGRIRIAVPRLPRISNFDDLDPLRLEPGVDLVLVESGRALPGDADLVILPGSKATLADLAALRAEGWDVDLAAHRRRGGWILGLCGGFQILGHRIADPHGLEGPAGEAAGLGMLAVSTTLDPAKRLEAARGTDARSGTAVAGYEMHMGVTEGDGLAHPMLHLQRGPDGAVSDDGRVMGCYLHGLFASDAWRSAFLAALGGRSDGGLAYEATVDTALDELAATVAASVDLDRLLAIARGA